MVASKSFFLFTDAQYKWLQKDLASVNRDVTPWLVATWHPPWYTTYRSHYREAECMKVAMEDLLYQYGVDIVFNGHVSFPIAIAVSDFTDECHYSHPINFETEMATCKMTILSVCKYINQIRFFPLFSSL